MKKFCLKRISILLASAFLLHQGRESVYAENQCSKNFIMEQDRFGARKYRTWSVLERVDDGQYFDALYRYAVKDGLRIDAKDRDMGTLTASSEVSFSNGKRVSYNFLVERLGDGSSRITLVGSTPGGTFSRAVDAEKYFCEVIESIG